MFRRLRQYTALLSLLSGIVLLAVCSNALLCTLCPNMGGRSHHCIKEDSSSSYHNTETTMTHGHDGSKMSSMDLEDPPVVMSNMMTEHPAASEPDMCDFLNNQALDLTNPGAFIADAITRPTGPCSHCMMHSQLSVNSPSSSSGLNNSLAQKIVPDLSVVVVMPVSSSRSLVDVHDHGPPGQDSLRYILNSSFRI